MPWFGVRSVIQFDELYEERIVLFSASDFDSALERAEAEASDYAEAVGSGVVLGLHQAYELDAEALADSTEVFSLMRTSQLDAEASLSTHFDTGGERQE